MSLVIRSARTGEAGTLSELAMRSKAYWGYSAEFMEACRQELTIMPASIENPELHYQVGELLGKIVGYYCLERLPGTGIELEALFVDPEHIGSGIGRALLQHAKEHAVHLGTKTMFIQADPNAEVFYLAAGATRQGSRESGSIPGRLLPLLELELGSLLSLDR